MAALLLCACSGHQDSHPSPVRDAASEDAAREDAASEAGDDASVADAALVDAAGPVQLAPGESPPEGTPPYDPGDGKPRPSLCTRCGACSENLAVAPALHVAGGVSYDDPPPAGGAHDPCWTSFGVHQDEVPDERWVHNLEHGAAVFLYNCTDCAEDVAAIEQYVAAQPIALSTPYAPLPARFGVVAWGARLVSDCYDPEVFGAFVDAYAKRAPEGTSAPPPPGCPE